MNADFDLAYAIFVGLGLVAGFTVKTLEERRLNVLGSAERRWVAVGALVGAMLGAKLGLLLYVPWDAYLASFPGLLWNEWGGRTILGALFGGFLGVELSKKALGIRVATGDPYAIALPVGQAIGRLGCFVGGCCYGRGLDSESVLRRLGLSSHPAALYESALDLTLAGVLFAIRKRPRPAGLLFRYYLIAYALIRIAMDPFRGDERQSLGPLSAAQWFCLACAVALAVDVRRRWRAR